MENEEKFSDDEIENLRIENELLRIKLKAQYGEAFQMSTIQDLPPEIENQFLKNILAYEDHNEETEMTTVYKKIGEPPFASINELDADAVSPALSDITNLMNEKGIFLDIADGPYPDETIYQFITEELFAHEIEAESVFGPGWHFIYEEFHPNNKADIEKNTHAFFRHWIEGSFDEFCTELSFHFMTAEGEQLNQKSFLQMMKNFFDSFLRFENDGYNIYDISFSEMEDGKAMGYSEGMYKYDAVMESGEVIHHKGPYKLYMQRENNSWDIFYFVVPGFSWLA